MPGDRRHAEPELAHQFGLHFEAAAAERRERAGGAAELADQHPRTQLLEALLVPPERGEDGRHLVAEGDRHGLLQIAAPGHRRIAVSARDAAEGVGDRVDIRFDQGERLADLQHRGAVGHVLGGGAPMAPFTVPVAAERYQLLHHRQHRIADALGVLLQPDKIDFAGVAMADDFLRGRRRDDAEARLRPRQRRREVEIFLHAVRV